MPAAQLVKIAKKAKLHNRHTEDYKQTVNGVEYFIPAGGHITISRRDAIRVKGWYCGPKTVCMLEIEPIYEMAEAEETFVNHRTGEVFPTRSALLRSLGVDPDAKPPEPQTVEKEVQVYVCPHCMGEFKSKQGLVKHMGTCKPKEE